MSEAASQDAVEEIMQLARRLTTDYDDDRKIENALEQRIRELVTALDETAQHLHYVQHLFTDGSPKHYTDCAVQPCQNNRAIKAQYDAKEPA
jgi:hypothetical protein